MNTNKEVTRRQFLHAAAGISTAALLSPLVGCGGGSGGNHNPFLNGDSGLFVGADQPVGNGFAHTHIELKNGLPIRQGLEFTPAALEGLTRIPPDLLFVTFAGPMPAKTHGSQFTNVFLVYVTSHTATEEPPHFHAAMLIRPGTITAEPYEHERAAVAAREIPKGYVRATAVGQEDGVVVAGGGVVYDDPTVPAGKPADTTVGHNYLYYDGHMNGMVLGPTLQEMKTKDTITLDIPQPEYYPRDGYYPRKWTTRFDAERNMHVLEMFDFIRATKIVPVGT